MHALDSLTEELDELTRSLDKNVTFQELHNTSSTRRNAHGRDPPTATSVSSINNDNNVDVSSLGEEEEASDRLSPIRPLQEPMTNTMTPNAISTGEKRNNQLNDLVRRTREDKKTAAEPDRSFLSSSRQPQEKSFNDNEPPSLQSPPFHFYSPLVSSAKSPMRDRNRSASANTKGGRSRLFEGAAVDNSRDHRATLLAGAGQGSWQPVSEDIHHILLVKEDRIRSLEQENAFLRSKLDKALQMLEAPVIGVGMHHQSRY